MVDPPTATTGLLTDISGVAVGHWSDPVAATGCTVVLVPPGTVASGEVRGGAPASRELALLDPSRLVSAVDAVVLTGGSAFGLASADGVVAWLAEQDRGFPTAAGPVPIVPALALFDLTTGDGSVRPGPAEGRAAAEAASTDGHTVGRVGAGTGCTVDKGRGPDHARPGGLVAASIRVGQVVVGALVAVNAVGTIDADGRAAARALDAFEAFDAFDDEGAAGPRPTATNGPQPFANTTIGVVATNARLAVADCLLVAQSAHDGLARAIFPAHTRFDGDAFVALATGAADGDLDQIRLLATAVVERAIRSLA